jgi:hypothetical protein
MFWSVLFNKRLCIILISQNSCKYVMLLLNSV